MKSNYNRDLIATAKSKALTYSRPFAKHKAYRIFCRAAAAFVCRLHTLVCAALILSLLATWTPAVPQTIVALIKESSVSLGRGRSAIPNPQSALPPASDPKVELPSNLLALHNSVKLPEAWRPKVDPPLDDSSTPLFAPSVRAAKLYAALMPQGNGYIYRRT